MNDLRLLQTTADLAAWDWRAELDAQGRSLAWLARQIGARERTVYSWSAGQRTMPMAVRRDVASVLGMRVAEGAGC